MWSSWKMMVLCSVVLNTVVIIKFITKKNALFIKLPSFKIYIQNHFDLLLHVSVYDDHQAAFIRA